jgi:hypothetical protein
MPQISVTNDLALAGLLRVFTPFDLHTLNFEPNEVDLDEITLGYSYNSNTSNGSTNDPRSQFSYSYANRYDPKMKLMKGVPPTYNELNTILSRTSDVLVTFSPQSLTNPNMWVNNGETPSILLQSTDLASASASGTATWLWWHSGSNTGLGTGGVPYIQAIFTVGTPGSGSDFEMPTTDIVSGRGYKLINGPRLTMATEFNY